VRRSFSFACLVVAWLCANGAVLDAVQVIAWGRMFATYAHSFSVGEAVRRTFDGHHPCALCRAVDDARAADRGPAPAPAPLTIKLTLYCHQTESFVPPAAPGRQTDSEATPGLTRRYPVPVPPPRDAVVVVG